MGNFLIVLSYILTIPYLNNRKSKDRNDALEDLK